jgi:hypothetical protein
VEPTFHSLPIRTRTGLKPTEDLYHKDTKDTKKQKITQEGRKGRKVGKKTVTRVRHSKSNPRRTCREASRAYRPLRRAKCLLRAGKSPIRSFLCGICGLPVRNSVLCAVFVLVVNSVPSGAFFLAL